MAGRWLTPDSIPAATRCRVLLIPDEINIYAAVSGALLPLIYEHNWQQFGAVTPAAISLAMESMYTAFLNSECEGFANVESYLFAHVENQNVGGGTHTVAAENRLLYNTSRFASPQANVTLSAGAFTFQPGIYTVHAWHQFRFTGDTYIRMENAAGGQITNIDGMQDILGSSLMRTLEINHVFSLTTVNAAILRGIGTLTVATTGLGNPINEAGHSEVYGEILIHRLGDAA